MLNTSGIFNYTEEAQFEMVRLGIGLYGFGNEQSKTAQLARPKTIFSRAHARERKRRSQFASSKQWLPPVITVDSGGKKW